MKRDCCRKRRFIVIILSAAKRFRAAAAGVEILRDKLKAKRALRAICWKNVSTIRAFRDRGWAQTEIVPVRFAKELALDCSAVCYWRLGST
jgi:hypothetical protein